MLNRYRRGTTAENNGWTLPEGMLSIDSEKKAIRIHDGQTPGGYEAVGSAIEYPIPGPQELIGGTTQAGYYGEVSGNELVSYEDLALTVGVTEGTLLYNDESTWLKFSLDGNVLFIAKRPIRSAVSWNTLNASGVVFPGGAALTRFGHAFDVTLPSTALANPTEDASGFDVIASHGSEWNRLMYHILDDATANNRLHTTASESSERWALIDEKAMTFHYGDGSTGTRTLCQETHGYGEGYAVYRGYQGLAYFNRTAKSDTSASMGWRPVLRLRQAA